MDNTDIISVDQVSMRFALEFKRIFYQNTEKPDFYQ